MALADFPHLFEGVQAFLVEELADSTDAALRSEQIQNPPEEVRPGNAGS
jgi:hypothetical protein